MRLSRLVAVVLLAFPSGCKLGGTEYECTERTCSIDATNSTYCEDLRVERVDAYMERFSLECQAALDRLGPVALCPRGGTPACTIECRKTGGSCENPIVRSLP